MIKELLNKLIYWAATKRFFTKIKKSHLSSITGVENLPERGPFIVVANHSSYADHYTIGAIFKHLYNESLYFLTKKEAFNSPISKIFHEATYCIPVDRDKPDINAFKQMMQVLKEGRILVIYPEGTRGPGDYLLPFKRGALKLAAKMKVPIVPIGLVGMNKVMPKGQSYFSRHKGAVNIGNPLEVKYIQSLPEDDLIQELRNTIFNLALAKERPHERISSSVISSNSLATFVESHVETILEDGDYKKVKKIYPQLKNVIDYSYINCPEHLHTMVQETRLYGLKLMASPKILFLLKGHKIKKMVKKILKQDKEHAFGHYIIGQYYLKLPPIFGGSIKRAVDHLKQAYANAPVYNLDSSRFILAYAEALERSGEQAAALATLSLPFKFETDDTSERTRRRLNRIQERISDLMNYA